MGARNYAAPTPPMGVTINGSSVYLIFEENWESTLSNRVFPFVIWLRTPSPELRTLALSRMKLFPEAARREEWLCASPADMRQAALRELLDALEDRLTRPPRSVGDSLKQRRRIEDAVEATKVAFP